MELIVFTKFTATVGEDYKDVSEVVVINAGTSFPAKVLVPIFNDECVENDENFSVILTTASSSVKIGISSVEITIIDDDC